MKLQEYQAKGIFSQFGIKIPRGRLATSLGDVRKISEDLGGKVVVKSQVLVGGRGKAGGIKQASCVKEAVECAGGLFGRIIKGHVVKKLYVEELLDIDSEIYVGFTYDGLNSCASMVVSGFGGVDVEEIVEKNPDKVVRKNIDLEEGLWDFQVRETLYRAQIPTDCFKEVLFTIKLLYSIFEEYEAELCEINPLVITRDRRVYAVDGRLNFDDDALYRHVQLMELKDYTQANPLEKVAEKDKLRYVKLDGNIGIIAAGAGMGLATADLVFLTGGKPANFLDIGGAEPEIVKKSFGLLLQDKDVKAIFVNVLGGLTRCELVADGIIKAFDALAISLPVVVRLAGTNEEEGRTLIQEYVLKTKKDNMLIVETMEKGAEKVVSLVQEEMDCDYNN